MPQARLPDINTAFIMYRREALQNYKSKNYSMCIGCLYSLNALLPQKYRVIVSDIEYDKKTLEKITLDCPKCKETFDFKDIQIFELAIPLTEYLFSDSKKEKIWYCPKCKVRHRLADTEPVRQIQLEPYFLSVVPKPPHQKDGLISRNRYFKKFSVWYWMICNELEERMAQFRDDNWTKEDELYQEGDVIEGGEES